MLLFIRFLIWLGYHTTKLCGESWGHANCCRGYVTKQRRLMLTWEESEVRNEKVFTIRGYKIYKNGYMELTSSIWVIKERDKGEIHCWKSSRPALEDNYVPHS